MSDSIRDLIQQLGGFNTTVLFEENSRNTYENAVNSRQVFAAEPGTNWILITSASHMPRAVGSFAAAGWTGIIPHPVDYQTPKTGHISLWSIERGIPLVRQGLHEYAGLLVYYLTGRSTNLYPINKSMPVRSTKIRLTTQPSKRLANSSAAMAANHRPLQHQQHGPAGQPQGPRQHQLL